MGDTDPGKLDRARKPDQPADAGTPAAQPLPGAPSKAPYAPANAPKPKAVDAHGFSDTQGESTPLDGGWDSGGA